MQGSKRRLLALAATAAAGGMLLTACLQNPNQGGGAAGGGGTVVDNNEPDGDSVVTILGGFGGAEQAGFEAAIADFEAETGIDIQYSNDTDFTTSIRTRISAGTQPDLAFFSQPGGVLQLAESGDIAPIDTYLDYDQLESTLIPGFLDAAQIGGRTYAAPLRLSAKSFVWYNLATYEAGGYNTNPTTMAELYEVSAEISDTGTPAWCMGWGADQATGWVGTDWIEEYMLRLHGPDVYDQWTSHEIPFNDPLVVEAFDAFGELVFTEGWVEGGPQGVIAESNSTAILGAFEDPPSCFMERQGTFVTSFMPEDVQADLDANVGVFALPPIEGGFEGQPIMGSGDLITLMNGDDPDSIAVARFLASDEFGAEWAAAGGFLSPHATFDPSSYPNDVTRQTAQIVSEAAVFRFDGSDLMPTAIGGDAFFDGMVEWLSGDKTSEEVTTDIENAWPTEDDS